MEKKKPAGTCQVDRAVRRWAVAALVLACAGCSVEQREAGAAPKGWKSFVAPGNVMTYVAPVTMDDGTRCVVTFGNSAGSGVSCDYSSAK